MCLREFGEKHHLPYTSFLRRATRALTRSEEGSRDAWVVAEGDPRQAGAGVTKGHNCPSALDSVSSRCPETLLAWLHVLQAHFGVCIYIFSAVLGGHGLKGRRLRI